MADVKVAVEPKAVLHTPLVPVTVLIVYALTRMEGDCLLSLEMPLTGFLGCSE